MNQELDEYQTQEAGTGVNEMITPDITFSPSQEEALKLLSHWLFCGAEQPIVLTGAAGTGKTTLLKYFLAQNKKNLSPIITAPTNPATKVLEQSMGGYGGFPVKTTQAAFTMVMNLRGEYRTMNVVDNQAMDDYDTLIVDECSIVNSHLFRVVTNFSGNLIFSGHISQLPAVEDDGVEREVGVVFEHEEYQLIRLREAWRNAGELAEYCQSLEDRIYKPAPISGKYMKFARQLPKLLEEQAEGLADGSCQLLAYTNERVREMNEEVRKILFSGTKELILPNDRMMVPDYAHKFGASLGRKSNTLTGLYKRARSSMLSANTRFTVHAVQPEVILGVRCFELTISVEDEGTGKPSGFLYLPQDMIAFEKLRAEYKQAAYKLREGKAKAKAWLNYHTLLMLFPLARHCYASTVHSAQGRTINSVIADMTNIETCRNEVIGRKLAYVAASRAKSKLITLK